MVRVTEGDAWAMKKALVGVQILLGTLVGCLTSMRRIEERDQAAVEKASFRKMGTVENAAAL